MFTKEKEMAVPATEEKAAPKSHGSGNMSGKYYKIEVRSWHAPRVLHDRENPRHPYIIDKEWREWPVRLAYGEGPAPSMPVGYCERHPAEHGLLTYDAAMGHLWGMHAFLAANHMDLCIQARLVCCSWHESYSITEESVSDVVMAPRRPWDNFMARDEANAKALLQQS